MKYIIVPSFWERENISLSETRRGWKFGLTSLARKILAADLKLCGHLE